MLVVLVEGLLVVEDVVVERRELPRGGQDRALEFPTKTAQVVCAQALETFFGVGAVRMLLVDHSIPDDHIVRAVDDRELAVRDRPQRSSAHGLRGRDTRRLEPRHKRIEPLDAQVQHPLAPRLPIVGARIERLDGRAKVTGDEPRHVGEPDVPQLRRTHTRHENRDPFARMVGADPCRIVAMVGSEEKEVTLPGRRGPPAPALRSARRR